MSAMDKFLKAMKLSGEDDEFYDDDTYFDDERAPESALPPRKESVKTEPRDRETVHEREREMPGAPMEERKVKNNTPIRQMPSNRQMRKAGATMQQQHGMEICAIKPTSMEDTREVTDTLLKNRTVVLNLEGIDVDVAQRIVDFVSGSCYAIKGNLQKISRYIFIITPASVDISGDFQEMIGGTFGATNTND